MISDKILVTVEELSLTNGMKFPKDTEFHIVKNVVYMQGYPLPHGYQEMILRWIDENPTSFKEIFR